MAEVTTARDCVQQVRSALRLRTGSKPGGRHPPVLPFSCGKVSCKARNTPASQVKPSHSPLFVSLTSLRPSPCRARACLRVSFPPPCPPLQTYANGKANAQARSFHLRRTKLPRELSHRVVVAAAGHLVRTGGEVHAGDTLHGTHMGDEEGNTKSGVSFIGLCRNQSNTQTAQCRPRSFIFSSFVQNSGSTLPEQPLLSCNIRSTRYLYIFLNVSTIVSTAYRWPPLRHPKLIVLSFDKSRCMDSVGYQKTSVCEA